MNQGFSVHIKFAVRAGHGRYQKGALDGSKALHRLTAMTALLKTCTAFNGPNTAVNDLTAPPGATVRRYCSI